MVGVLQGDIPQGASNRYDALSTPEASTHACNGEMAGWQANKLTAVLLVTRPRTPWKLIY